MLMVRHHADRGNRVIVVTVEDTRSGNPARSEG
jgi:hypothetical protein